MKKEEFAKEVGLVAAIMGDHITKRLYKEVQRRGNGYIFTIDMLSDWAVEFVKKHCHINWEKVLGEGMPCVASGGGTNICWDDAVMDYANYKLEQYKKS